MELKENERIDDLQLNNLKIIQNKKYFCFGIDSILLSDFAKEIQSGSEILDLGAGNGILELLLSEKVKDSKITGIEVQGEICEIAKRNIELNKLENRIKIKNMNIKELNGDKKYDAVVTNPPYKEKGTGLLNNINTKTISRHEILGNLDDFIKAASISLKNNGAMYMINRPERLVDIFEYSRNYKLEPKTLTFIYPKINKPPVLILIKAIKNANRYLNVMRPLYIYGEDGKYTEEIKKIYIKE